jgi:DNA-binding cell septation regulator SpoVG
MNERISEIQITPVKPRDGLVGFASFVFDNCFYLGSIGIFTRPEGGYRLTYPTRKSPISNFVIFHPINKETASMVEAAIISKYEAIIAASL